ncbi:MAG: Unknown protein [uncultured Sulfurovum sp.]|uniref:DUF4153 domain-containing protein n=1 Tax=uncultured Sulfurovum sp. TaxID=269237 RepID=A0A6S6UF48_9BACT|nr:MAG: Unknown protein [uncultured Sulfurovum sp.]
MIFNYFLYDNEIDVKLKKKGNYMSGVYEKMNNQIETFLSTLKRFPLASFSAFLITLISVILVDTDHSTNPNTAIALKIVFVATLGLVLFPALQLLTSSRLFSLFGLILLAIYYYLLPSNLESMYQNTYSNHTLLIIAFFSMIFWAPFVFKKSNNDIFWQYAQSLIFGFITALFFSIIIYLGLSGALFTIKELFQLNITSFHYGQLAIIIFGIFGMNFFLSQIPKHPLFIEVRPYSKIKHLFVKNILAPMSLIFFIILLIYTLKVLISLKWPEGTLSITIVSFSILAIVSFLFLTPYLKKSISTQRLIWFAIFFQTLILLVALWIRIEEYGITYNRYLLGMFGTWLLLMSLYFMIFGKAQQKWLFFFLTLFILISQFGDYSIENLSKKSQINKLVKLIETAHPRSEELNMKTKYEISNRLDHLENYHGIKVFEKVIPSILKKYEKAKERKEMHFYNNNLHLFSYFATNELGFQFVHKWDWEQYKRNNKQSELYYFRTRYTKNQYIDTKGYDFLVKFSFYANAKINTLQIKKTLNIQFQKYQLDIKDNNRSISSINLKPFIDNLLTKSQRELSQQQMTYIEENNQSRFKIIFQKLSIEKEKGLKSFNANILLTIKEP